MFVDDLLARLDGVRQTGRGRWVSRCPSHLDDTPSLAIRELDDHRILVHDFGGCSVHEVLGALGLDVADLFPDRDQRDFRRRERRPFHPADVLKVIVAELHVVVIAAGDLAAGGSLSSTDRERLQLAADRLLEAEEYAQGDG